MNVLLLTIIVLIYLFIVGYLAFAAYKRTKNASDYGSEASRSTLFENRPQVCKQPFLKHLTHPRLTIQFGIKRYKPSALLCRKIP